MSLPKLSIPTGTVTVEGQTLQVRGLTRGENAYISTLIDAQRIEDAEVYILSKGTDTELGECEEWYANTSNRVVEAVLNEIGALTRLSEGATKSGT
jgi:hypothetical protein